MADPNVNPVACVWRCTRARVGEDGLETMMVAHMWKRSRARVRAARWDRGGDDDAGATGRERKLWRGRARGEGAIGEGHGEEGRHGVGL